jgi:hypothetical protein
MYPGPHGPLWREYDARRAVLQVKQSLISNQKIKGQIPRGLTPYLLFGSGGALMENINLYAEPFPLVA